jgi:RNA polymerase sigma factor (sigma-70 family)
MGTTGHRGGLPATRHRYGNQTGRSAGIGILVMTAGGERGYAHGPDHGQGALDLPTGELLARAGQGEPAAWAEIIKQYGRLVLRTAARIGLSRSDAADVAQATWLQLWKQGRESWEPNRLEAWLVSTARREAIRLAVASRKYVLYADPSAERSLASRTAVHDQYAALQGFSCAVAEAMDRLPARYKTLLRLLSCDLDLSYSEVAGQMGLPIGSIGPMRMRAIRMLEMTPEFGSGGFRRAKIIDAQE